jgi:regulator of replication initiation timing
MHQIQLYRDVTNFYLESDKLIAELNSLKAANQRLRDENRALRAENASRKAREEKLKPEVDALTRALDKVLHARAQDLTCAEIGAVVESLWRLWRAKLDEQIRAAIGRV